MKKKQLNMYHDIRQEWPFSLKLMKVARSSTHVTGIKIHFYISRKELIKFCINSSFIDQLNTKDQ